MLKINSERIPRYVGKIAPLTNSGYGCDLGSTHLGEGAAPKFWRGAPKSGGTTASPLPMIETALNT